MKDRQTDREHLDQAGRSVPSQEASLPARLQNDGRTRRLLRCDLSRACSTAWRLWGWFLDPSSMCPGRAPACSPRPPLTSPGWTLSPGPGRAAFSVSTPSISSRSGRGCCCSRGICYHGALSPQEESNSFRFHVPILTLHFVCFCA